MRKSRFILILLIAQWSQAQNPTPPLTYDTLPTIRSLNQQLDLLNKIRCAAYLFARNFTLKDSLGSIFLSLYYEKDNQETFPEQIKATSNAIFNVVYSYAFENNIDYLKESYQYFVVSAYDKNGKLIDYQDYPFRMYEHEVVNDYLQRVLQRIRIPNTWGKKDKQYRIVYYCMDTAEKDIFWQPLLLILSTLKILNKQCTTWKEYYQSCNDIKFCESATIKLPK
ncbi:MAG: hypothetical protein ABI675_02720 [Chitinophagaceae bacterium]